MLPRPSLPPSLFKFMSIESVMPSNHPILCRPLLLLPSIFPNIRVFSSELGVPIRWSKYWSFSFSISPSSECSELISFRIDWFDLLAVQGTLSSLLQHHTSKASILQQSTFFIVQLSHPYMTTRKNIALTLTREAHFIYSSMYMWASLVAQTIKNLPTMQKTQVQSVGQEDPLVKGMATHPSILAWEVPWTEEPGGLQSTGLQSIRRD